MCSLSSYKEFNMYFSQENYWERPGNDFIRIDNYSKNLKMKQIKLFICILILCVLGCSSKNINNAESKFQSFAPDGIPFVVSDSIWDVNNRGNHRATVFVEKKEYDAVLVNLPWRRPDLRPETKKIIVVDEHTGNEIKDIAILSFSSELTTIAFRPEVIPGKYYIYYLPYKYRTGWDDARYGEPWNDYIPPEYETNEEWEKVIKDNQTKIPIASVLNFESRTKFDFFTPMGLIATQKEKDNLIAGNNDDFLLFPEDRAFPIKLNSIPVRWINQKPSDIFTGNASLNEYYTWQIGLWAFKKELQEISVSITDFIHETGKSKIDKKDITCFNIEGTNWDGNKTNFKINVPKGDIQALWFGIQIPQNTKPGKYKGKILISAKNSFPKTVDININVDKNILADKGDSELWRHSRLRWLNSTIGIDSLPVEPYKPMVLQGNLISATDKYVTVSQNGNIESIKINEHEILSSPIEFLVESASGPILFKTDKMTIHKDDDGLVTWNSICISKEGIMLDCHAFMEYDGYIHYNVKLSSERNITIQNIKLVNHLNPESAEYFMGAGYKGGVRPSNHIWKWDGPYDSFWIGGDKSGLHVELRGGEYHGPLLNDYKPSPPEAWANHGQGQLKLDEQKGNISVEISTGPKTISALPLDFEFALLITPVKPLDTEKQFSQKYYHSDEKGFAAAAEEGANIINIHHSRRLNPVINYPFTVRDSLKSYIEEQHKHNRKVKLYYTIRELTNYTEEIFALKSLKHEIFVPGVGYGTPWHCEHLIDDYKPAWYTQLPNQMADAALVLNGFSRWINYYLEGLRWMLENYKIDGIYMDDVSFDRTVMKRIRKILKEYRSGALIDLHSNTAYSIGPANQYTGFFPYVDRLWFGESFKYNEMTPDEWFVTFSGIPFGVMSEMLQDGGNRFLGMVYGATGRHSYSQYSPAPVWRLWQDFNIKEAEMLGYWDKDCPVKTSNQNVKATAFVKPDEVLISIGNFDNKDIAIKLNFDWSKININPQKAFLECPEIQNFQQKTTFSLDDFILIPRKKGKLLILKEIK